jgi:hypothetical protein
VRTRKKTRIAYFVWGCCIVWIFVLDVADIDVNVNVALKATLAI